MLETFPQNRNTSLNGSDRPPSTWRQQMAGVIVDFNEAAVLASLAKNYLAHNADDLSAQQFATWQQLINKLEAK